MNQRSDTTNTWLSVIPHDECAGAYVATNFYGADLHEESISGEYDNLIAIFIVCLNVPREEHSETMLTMVGRNHGEGRQSITARKVLVDGI